LLASANALVSRITRRRIKVGNSELESKDSSSFQKDEPYPEMYDIQDYDTFTSHIDVKKFENEYVDSEDDECVVEEPECDIQGIFNNFFELTNMRNISKPDFFRK
jgi:hypothetical protein